MINARFRRSALCGIIAIVCALAPSAYAQGPTIIAASQNSAPKYFPADNQRRGVCGDIYAALDNRLHRNGLGLTIDQEPLPIKRILHNLETGKMHIFCGAGRNAAREKLFDYSISPIWHTSNVVMTAADNPVRSLSFRRLAREGVVVGAFFGTSSARFLMKQDGVKVDEGYKSLENALWDVAKGDLAYFYYHDLGLNWLLRQNPQHKARLVDTKFRTVPQWMLYSRSLPGPLQKLVDRQVTYLADSGEIEAIMARYRPDGY